MTLRARDIFAGAGGWDVAADRLGWDVDGWEILPAARVTRIDAGHRTVGRDVRDIVPALGEYDVEIASPPCQTFSMTGTGCGRRDMAHIVEGVAMYANGGDARAHLRAVADERTELVLEPLRIALGGMPTYIAWEQVPTVLPVWESCGRALVRHGYSVATGILNAEQHGVPQTRRRAVLIARRDGGTAALPTPTHSRFHVRTPGRLDAGVLSWVSMGDALGWADGVEVVSNYGTGGDPANRGVRDSSEPFATVTSKADRMRVVLRNGNQDNACVRDIEQPSGTLFFGKRANWVEWELRSSARTRACVRNGEQPGFTITAGHDYNERTWAGPDGERKITLPQAAILQTFPADYPFAGTKGDQFLQVGNAVPPLLAERILRALVS
jgi:DNA (cytosine-5)-methyltransferase 1